MFVFPGTSGHSLDGDCEQWGWRDHSGVLLRPLLPHGMPSPPHSELTDDVGSWEESRSAKRKEHGLGHLVSRRLPAPMPVSLGPHSLGPAGRRQGAGGVIRMSQGFRGRGGSAPWPGPFLELDSCPGPSPSWYFFSCGWGWRCR